MEIKYKTNIVWSGGVSFCLLFMLILVLPNLINDPIYHTLTASNVIGIGVFIFGIIFLSLYAFFGLYVTLGRERLCRTDYFFWKKCFLIKDIETITYPPTFIVGRANRTLTIIANMDGKYEKISMSNPAFHRKTLIKIIKDLKERNSAIKLDDDARIFSEDPDYFIK